MCSSIATRLSFFTSFWQVFDYFCNHSISFAYQTQKAWNQSLSTTEFWKNLLLCKKLNLTKVWAGIKSCLNPTLTFDKQTCNVFHHMFTLVLKICLVRFKPEAIRLIKNVSSKTDVKSLFGWLSLGTFDCKHHKINNGSQFKENKIIGMSSSDS